MNQQSSLFEERYKKVQKSIDTYITTRCQSFKEISAPLFVGWEVTSRCNLHCQHCRAADNNSKKNMNELPFRDCKKIIDQLSRSQVYTVGITGGEPFVRSDIFDIIEQCKAYKLQVIVYTNATMIDNSMSRKLSQVLDKHDIVHVSLDADRADVHNMIRGSDCFDRTIKGLENLSNMGLQIRLNVVPTRINADHILGLVDVAERYHVRYFSGSPLMTISRGKNSDLVPDPVVMYKLEQEIYSRMMNSDVEFEGGISGAPCTMYSFREKISREYPKRQCPTSRVCDAGTRKLFIDALGDCYPCSLFALDSRLCMGNITQKSIEEIWSNRRMSFLKRGVNRHAQICGDCELWNICDGGCMALSLNHFGNVSIPDPRCEKVQKMIRSKTL